MIINTGRLKEISEIEFGDIVDDVVLTDINEIRIILIDGSFIDVWKDTPTFPKHFHNGSEDTAAPSYIPDDAETALREFLKFAREALKKLNVKKDLKIFIQYT